MTPPRTPTTLFDCTCLPLNRRLMAHLLKVDEGSVHEQGCVERAVAEAHAPLDVDRLLPFLRHTNYCVLRNVRDNAPWDEACDCGLAALVHEPEPKSRVAE